MDGSSPPLRVANFVDNMERTTQHIVQKGRTRADFAFVLATVSQIHSVPRPVMLGRARFAYVVYARHLVAFLLRRSGWGVSEIARALDRNHSTVIHALHSIEDQSQVDHRVSAHLTALEMEALSWEVTP